MDIERIRPYTDRLALMMKEGSPAEAVWALEKLRSVSGGLDTDARKFRTEKSTDIYACPWQPVLSDGELRLREDSPLVTSGLWANQQRTWNPRASRRIVLIGESVARGFFYDPEFTFADALFLTLQEASAEPIAVVDLAKTDATISDLELLLPIIEKLEPTYIVMFAGNNWCISQPGVAELDSMGLVLRRMGWEGVALSRKRRIISHINTITDKLDRVSHKINASMVCVVPATSEQWIVPEQHHFEYDYLLPLGHTPWCPEFIRRELLDQSISRNWVLVDAKDHTSSDGFLDYCHIDAPSMARLAQVITNNILGIRNDQNTSGLLGLDSQVKSTAYMLAAAHNSLYGQPASSISYLIRKAFAEGEAELVASKLLDVAASTLPVWLTKSGQWLLSNPQTRKYFWLSRGEVGQSLMGAEFIKGLLEQSKSSHLPYGLRREPVQEIDMLAGIRRRKYIRNIDLRKEGGLYRAATSQSNFKTFVVSGNYRASVCLDATSETSGVVKVLLNGKCIGETHAKAHRCFVLVAHSSIMDAQDEVHEVSILWPGGVSDDLADACRMESGEYPEVTPTYGRIWSLELKLRDSD